MLKQHNYVRTMQINRGEKTINVPNVGNFKEVIYKNVKTLGELIEGHSFYTFHQIVGTAGQIIMNAYKSKTCPEILFIEWRDLPYTHHIEQGGDVMIQELLKGEVKYLLIDNTYLQSGWMNDKITEYFHTVWYPSLIQLGLKGFAHIQSLSALGGASFEKFKTDVQAYVNTIAKDMNKSIFTYIPVEVVGENKLNRAHSLNLGYKSLKSL